MWRETAKQGPQETHDETPHTEPTNWLDNMRIFENNSTPHPQIYTRDTVRNRPAYEYAGSIQVTLQNRQTLTCKYRAPEVDFRQPYACCIGAAQTFGRCVLRPYPQLLAENISDVQIANLSYGGAGPQFYLGVPEYLEILNGASFVVVQVMSARGSSSSLWKVIWGNRGIRLSDNRQMTFPAFVRQMNDHDTYRRYVEETREQYYREMLGLLAAIRVPKILTWISHTPPPETLNSLPYFPHFVDLDFVAQFRRHSQAYVECVGERSDFKRYYPSQRVHTILGQQLLRTLIENRYVKPKHALTMRPDRPGFLSRIFHRAPRIVAGPIQ